MTELERQQREKRRQKIKQRKRKRILGISLLVLVMALIIFLVVKLVGLIFSPKPTIPDVDPNAVAYSYPAWPLQYTTVASALPPFDYTQPVPESAEADASYFSGAIFIGDSRIEALQLYNTIPGAEYACSGSINVDNALTLTFQNGEDKFTLEQKLQSKEYTAIYLMFGLNELGWSYESSFAEGYTALIAKIKNLQPGAAIYVQSIIPVSAARNANGDYVNNQKIQTYNALLQELATKQEVFYIDVASALSDESGALLAEAAEANGIAITQTYNTNWYNYLKKHTVNKEKLQ